MSNIFQKVAAIFSAERFRQDAARGQGFSRAATWTAMISAITGGYVGLSTYSLDVSKQVDESVAKTFDMIQAYNSSDLAESRTRVLSYVYARRECDARIFSRDLTDEDFIRVLEFYDLVHACTEAKLCDRKTAEQFFEPHATFQWPVLQRVVGQMREEKNTAMSMRSDASFAVGMASLADKDATAPPCDGNF